MDDFWVQKIRVIHTLIFPETLERPHKHKVSQRDYLLSGMFFSGVAGCWSRSNILQPFAPT